MTRKTEQLGSLQALSSEVEYALAVVALVSPSPTLRVGSPEQFAQCRAVGVGHKGQVVWRVQGCSIAFTQGMLLCGIGSLLEGPCGQSGGRFGQGMVPGFTVFQQIIAKGQTLGTQKLVEFKESCLRSGIQSGSVAFKGLEALGQEHAVFGRSLHGQAHRRKASE